MNFPNDSSEHDNDINASSADEDDEEEETENFFLVQRIASNNRKTFDITDDDDDDIENHHTLPSHSSSSRQNRLSTILRQSNHLVELKSNLLHRHQPSVRLVISNSHLSKESTAQLIYSTRLRRLYLPSSSVISLQTQITNWLQASTCLIDSISTSTYHRRCWSQLLLTYFIERRFVDLQFLLCTDSFTFNSNESNSSSSSSCLTHQYACIPEEDASKLCSILQKGSRFNIDSNIFDHLRRIIVIKSMQESKCDIVLNAKNLLDVCSIE